MKFALSSVLAGTAIALSALPAQAQEYAFTARSVHLRAGPGRDYPVVAVLPPHTSIGVFACISGYSWCDVAAGPDRGWVYSGNIEYTYNGRDVLLPGVATVLGIAITTFILDDYWHDHYVDRPWWPQRRQWYRPAPERPVRPVPQPRALPAPHSVPPQIEHRPQDGPRPADVRPRQPVPRQQQPHPGQLQQQSPQRQPRERPRDQGE